MIEITTNDVKPEFKPVTLTLTFQSQTEVDAFYTLFNYTPIVDWIGNKVNDESFPARVRMNLKNSVKADEMFDSLVYKMERNLRK